jgi:hypothetical protein
VAGADDDLLLGLAGDHTVDGGPGNDLLVYPRSRAHYTITVDAAARTAVVASPQDGTDAVVNVERFLFSDSRLPVLLEHLSDATAPELRSAAPVAGARKVAVDAPLVFSFDEPVRLGAGPIQLKQGDGTVVRSFGAGEALVQGQTLRLMPAQKLGIYTDYILEFGAGAVEDLAGNVYAANTTVSFRTATMDELYHFFVVAFSGAPGATYMGQLAQAYNHFSAQPVQPGDPGVVQQIVEIFTTKRQFTDVYPSTMSNRELATQLINNVVKNSASAATKQAGINDIEAALNIGWSRGKMLYTVFGNLANLPLTDPTWGSTAKQFQKQLAVARYFTEEMGVATEDLATLRGVIGNVTPDTDVSTVDKVVQLIGMPPPGG